MAARAPRRLRREVLVFFGTIEDDRAAALRDVEDIGRRGSHDRSFRGSQQRGAGMLGCM